MTENKTVEAEQGFALILPKGWGSYKRSRYSRAGADGIQRIRAGRATPRRRPCRLRCPLRRARAVTSRAADNGTCAASSIRLLRHLRGVQNRQVPRGHRLGAERGRVSEHGAAETALSAPGLRSCVLASCGAREAHPRHFKSCASCRQVVYCCREHQAADS